MYSMTAYSCCTEEGEWGRLVWECRSVNHRYLDLFFRLPEAFHYLENKLREEARFLSRGKVECFLTFKFSSGLKNSYQSIDRERAKYLIDLCQEFNQWIESPAPIDLIGLLGRADIWLKEDMDVSVLEQFVLSSFKKLLSELSDHRRKEGNLLKNEIQRRMQEMLQILDAVKKHLPEILLEQRQKIISRLEELQGSLDTYRLEQEMIYLAQKTDVAEEMDRLLIHIQDIQQILQTEDKPVGRRLDFLMQELNRETNTLGSKTTSSDVTKAVVDLKVLIEQVREQIQNIV